MRSLGIFTIIAQLRFKHPSLWKFLTVLLFFLTMRLLWIRPLTPVWLWSPCLEYWVEYTINKCDKDLNGVDTFSTVTRESGIVDVFWLPLRYSAMHLSIFGRESGRERERGGISKGSFIHKWVRSALTVPDVIHTCFSVYYRPHKRCPKYERSLSAWADITVGFCGEKWRAKSF